MKSKQIDSNWVLRFEYGDDFIDQLSSWAQEHAVTSAFFHGLGAAKQSRIGYYNLEQKEYKFRDLDQTLEVVSLHGNISKAGDDLKVHAHTVLSDDNLQTYGGHIDKLISGPTLELFVTPIQEQLERAHDEFTGLELLDL